jgi:hypothetical protein
MDGVCSQNGRAYLGPSVIVQKGPSRTCGEKTICHRMQPAVCPVCGETTRISALHSVFDDRADRGKFSISSPKCGFCIV